MVEPFLKRQQPLVTLPSFATALTGIFAASPPEVQGAIEESLFAECVLCGIRVNGRELAEVSILDSTAVSEGKLARLRLGYCARNRCTSSIYELSFHYHPDLSWPSIVESLDAQLKEKKDDAEQRREEGAAERLAKLRAVKNFCMAATAALAMFVSWKLYYGGSIPFIREAEEFKVAPRKIAPSYDDPFGVKAMASVNPRT